VLNGSADNILRAARDYGYQPLLDPVHPGIIRPVIRNLRLLGTGQGPQGDCVLSRYLKRTFDR